MIRTLRSAQGGAGQGRLEGTSPGRVKQRLRQFPRDQEYHPDDLDRRSVTDSEHAFTTFPDEPCIAASANRGFDFFAWLLRVLQKLVGR